MTIDRLLAIMEALRAPETGCPWDLDQDLASIVPHTLEEAYEVADVIERKAWDELPGELGDLLFQVVFYCQIASERNMFGFAEVVAVISEKIERRHPHVFAGVPRRSATEQTEAWEAHKEKERVTRAEGTLGALDGVSRALPALSRAQALQRRAARVGFDWSECAQVLDKVDEELNEVRAAMAAGDREALAEELGDLLFSCVNLVRHVGSATSDGEGSGIGLDAESVLRAANAKFTARFKHMEEALAARGATLAEQSAASWDSLWNAAKERQ